MFVPPESSRCAIDATPGTVKIAIPARRKWFIILFLGGWMCGWAFGEASVIGSLFGIGPMRSARGHGSGLFLGGWLIAWTVGGAWALITWTQAVAGREIIWIADGRLSIRREAFGIGVTKEYDLLACKRLRRADRPQTPFASQFQGGFKSLVLDYGARSISFGQDLDEPEVALVMAALQRAHRFPDSPT